jgi:Holliday junction resolvase-like predicted endonuclease
MTEHSASLQLKPAVSSAPHGVLLQRKCGCGSHSPGGGECADCAKKRLQRKLHVGASSDALELEADRVAEQVTSMAAAPAGTSAGRGGLRTTRRPDTSMEPAPASVTRALANSGRPLEPELRQDMELRFGHDFSRVRVHADVAAGQSAKDVNAHAYTVGNDVVFGEGKFVPERHDGRLLLAHELTHVVQQSVSGTSPALMRKGFESTVEVCHRVLESRKFEVSNGGVRVVLAAQRPNADIPDCGDFDFNVSLTRSIDWWPDKEIGTCTGRTDGVRTFEFSGLPKGTYYLTFWRTFDNPNCCLEGDLMVYDEAQQSDGEGCRRSKDLSTMDIVHGALDLAGLIPALGAIPDGINAAIYVAQGDWVNAGLSAAAALPVAGDGLLLAKMGGKTVIKVEAKTAVKLGEEGLAKELKGLEAASKAEGKAVQSAEKSTLEATEKADAKALDETFQGGKGEGAYETTNRLKRGNLGEKLATDSLAADGHTILSYKPGIAGTNQGGIDMVTLKGDTVYFVDNKALTRGGNVSSVSALTTNFSKNKDAVLKELQAALSKAPTESERNVLQRAIEAIKGNRFKKVVTNANLTANDAILTGVTQKLRNQGIEFINVFKP